MNALNPYVVFILDEDSRASTATFHRTEREARDYGGKIAPVAAGQKCEVVVAKMLCHYAVTSRVVAVDYQPNGDSVEREIGDDL